MNDPISKITTEQIEEWIHLHFSYLLNRAYFLLSVKEDAEDVVQDVFLSLCQPNVSFEGKSSVRTWLTGILNNKIADVYKKRYRVVNVPFKSVFDEHGEWIDESALPEWDSEDGSMNDEDFTRVFQGCIDKLPSQWKIVINEAYFSEKKAPEICLSLNLSRVNYWKILQRSRIQLRKCLDLKWFNTL